MSTSSDSRFFIPSEYPERPGFSAGASTHERCCVRLHKVCLGKRHAGGQSSIEAVCDRCSTEFCMVSVRKLQLQHQRMLQILSGSNQIAGTDFMFIKMPG